MSNGLKIFMAFSLPLIFVFVMAGHLPAEEGDYYSGEVLYGKCSNCHSRSPNFAGNDVDELYKKMMRFKEVEPNTPALKLKKKIFTKLTDKEIRDLATYINEM